MAVGDWDRRELCPDGSCTGLIGPEGTCKVCGHVAPNWGDERRRGTADQDDEEEDEEEDEVVDEIAPSAPAKVGVWAKRQLCPDGACVGVIGDDGKCKVCGKAGESGTGSPGSDSDSDTDSEDEHEHEHEHDDDDDDDDAAAEDDDDAAAAEDDDDDDDAAAAADDDDDAAAAADDDDGDDDDDADDDDEDEDDADEEDDELAAAAAQLAGVAPSTEVAAAERMADDADEPERQLCPDGGCIGVIGDNGKCKICGKAAA